MRKRIFLPLAIAAMMSGTGAWAEGGNNCYFAQSETTKPMSDTLTFDQVDEFLKTKSGEVKLLVNLKLGTYGDSEKLGYIIRKYPNLVIDLEIAENPNVTGVNGFHDCKALRSVTLPQSIHEVGRDAFRNCENLESLIVNSPVQNMMEAPHDSSSIYIYCSALWGCKHFQKEGIVGNFNGMEFFYTDDDITDMVIPGKWAEFVTRYCVIDNFKNLKSIKIESGAERLGISYIDDGSARARSFIWNCPNLTTIEIEEGPKMLGGFPDLPSLENIKLPESLEYLYGMGGCPKLKNIKLPANLKPINREGKRVFQNFYDCKSLQSVEIPEGVEVIEEFTFSNCESLKTIKLPSSVKEIKTSIEYGYGFGYHFTSPFMNCKSLTSFEIPEGMEEIPDYLFWNCTSLKSVKIPASVKRVNSHAFANCKSLTKIVLPQNLEEIGDFAFEGCDKLKSITIPASVKTIGKGAFWACKTLKKDQDPYKITVSGRTFDYYPENVVCDQFKDTLPCRYFENFTAMKSIVIPDNIQAIGYNALSGCSSLSSIVWPKEWSSYVSREDEDNDYVDAPSYAPIIDCSPNLKTIDRLRNISDDQKKFIDTLLFEIDYCPEYGDGRRRDHIFRELFYKLEYTYGEGEEEFVIQEPSYLNPYAKIYVRDELVQKYKDLMAEVNKEFLENAEKLYYEIDEGRLLHYEFLPLSQYRN